MSSTDTCNNSRQMHRGTVVVSRWAYTSVKASCCFSDVRYSGSCPNIGSLAEYAESQEWPAYLRTHAPSEGAPAKVTTATVCAPVLAHTSAAVELH